MTVTFTVHRDKKYYIATFSGPITDEVILSEYSAFFKGEDWSPELNALVDFGDSDLTAVTSTGMKIFSQLVAGVARQHDWKPKVAVFAPDKLHYGLSRMYSKKVESFEEFSVFRDRQAAVAWLCEVQSKGLEA